MDAEGQPGDPLLRHAGGGIEIAGAALEEGAADLRMRLFQPGDDRPGEIRGKIGLPGAGGDLGVGAEIEEDDVLPFLPGETDQK